MLLISFVLGGLSVRQSSDLRSSSFDAMGLLYLAVSFTCLLLGCTELGHGRITFTAALLFAGFLLALFLFRKEEKKLANQGKRPLLHMGALRNRPFVLGALGLSLLQFLCLALGFLLPCFSQIVTGENAFAAGCILLPGCLLGALLLPCRAGFMTASVPGVRCFWEARSSSCPWFCSTPPCLLHLPGF